MGPLAIETMSMRGAGSAADKRQEKAEKVATQFEAVFVRTMVGSLRQTSSVGGESMFGSGPGADTYADWFDQNLADQIAGSSRIGIKEQLLADFEHNGEIAHRQKQVAAAATKALEAVKAAQRANLVTARTLGTGGSDVVL